MADRDLAGGDSLLVWWRATPVRGRLLRIGLRIYHDRSHGPRKRRELASRNASVEIHDAVVWWNGHHRDVSGHSPIAGNRRNAALQG